MQLSVIILNYNVCYFLELCVFSVKRALQHIEGEIIVVDNNSTDASCKMIKSRFPDVILIENKENFGFPKGNNIGVAHAKGEYICILNPDTFVAEDTFTKIVHFFTQKKQTSLGIVGCKLIDGTGHFLPESKRGIPTPWVAITKMLQLYKRFPNVTFLNKYYAMHLQENQSGTVDILVGAFMFLKKNLYENLSGFDENCFMYADDIDLSYRALQNGYSNYYLHQTSVIHFKGESTIRDKKYRKRFQEAMLYFYKKHFTNTILFNLFIKLGTFWFSLKKANEQKNETVETSKYIFFTKAVLPLQLNKEIEFKPHLEPVKTQNKIIQYIFNINDFSSKEIINFIEQNKNSNAKFSFYLRESKVIIGSHHANDIGEVIIL